MIHESGAALPTPGVGFRLIVFRVIASVQVVLVLAQSVFGGGFLSGHYGMLDLHQSTASAIVVIALVQIVAGAFLLRRPGLRRWPLFFSIAIFVMIGAQVLLGIERMLILHVPLAVLIFAAVVHTAWRAWQPVSPQSIGEIQ